MRKNVSKTVFGPISFEVFTWKSYEKTVDTICFKKHYNKRKFLKILKNALLSNTSLFQYFLKNDVMSLGGRVTKGMSMNILITKMFDKNSRKIKHAIKHHIPILKPTWVANAVEQADLMNAEFIVRRIETDFDSFIWQQNEDPVDDNNEEGDEDEHDNDDDNNDGNDDDDQVAMRHLEHHYFDGPSPPTPPPPPSPPAPPPPPPPPPPTRTRNRITVSTAAVTFPATCQNSDSIKEVKRLQQLLNNKLKKLTTSKSTEESKLAAIKVLQDLDNLKQFVQTEYIDE